MSGDAGGYDGGISWGQLGRDLGRADRASDSAYRSEAMAWLSKAKQHTDYIPKGMFDVNFASMTDVKLEGYLQAMHHVYRQNKQAPQKSGLRYMHLEPHNFGNGKIYFFDRNTFTYHAIMHPTAGGLAFMGPVKEDDASALYGGRGHFSTIFNMAADGDYLRDLKPGGRKE